MEVGGAARVLKMLNFASWYGNNIERSVKRFLSIILVAGVFMLPAFALRQEVVVDDSLPQVAIDIDSAGRVADSLYDIHDYKAAMEVMTDVLRARPGDEHFNYLMGACQLYAGRVREAKSYLERVQGNAGAVFLLGDALMKEDNYDAAAVQYERAAAMVTNPRSYLRDACNRRMRSARTAKSLSKRRQEIVVTDSVVVAKNEFFEHYDLSADAGQVFLVSEAAEQYDAPRTGYMAQRSDRMLFSDTVTGKRQTNIYQSNRLLDGWGRKKPVGDAINTKGNENFPFLTSDGMTLYFGSTHHGSIGGYDLFVSQYDTESGEWYEPQQLPMPINSTWNDYLYAIDEAQGVAWWATDRWQDGDSVVIYKYNVPKADDRTEVKKEEDVVDSLPFLKNIGGMTAAPVKKMAFDIGGGIVYTDLKQFKSNEAMRLYNEAVALETQYEQARASLAALRRAYGKEQDRTKRAEIGREILKSERIVNGTSKQKAEQYYQKARRIEQELRKQ